MARYLPKIGLPELVIVLLLGLLFMAPGDHPIIRPPDKPVDCESPKPIDENYVIHWFAEAPEEEVEHYTIALRPVCDGSWVWYAGTMNEAGEQNEWSEPSEAFTFEVPEPKSWALLLPGVGFLCLLAQLKKRRTSAESEAHVLPR